jgi:very-short-patch-repair endonuclease
MLHTLWPLIVIIIVLGIIAIVLRTFLSGGGRLQQNYPYEKEPVLFSPAERSFLDVLDQAVNGQLRIMGKVRLADVVKVKTGMNRSAWQNAFNRIQSKHVDFVACDPTTLGIQFVVELDDKTHNKSKRQDRDEFINKVLQVAGIPVFHFIAKRTYSMQDMRAVLFETKKEPEKKIVKTLEPVSQADPE